MIGVTRRNKRQWLETHEYGRRKYEYEEKCTEIRSYVKLMFGTINIKAKRVSGVTLRLNSPRSYRRSHPAHGAESRQREDKMYSILSSEMHI